jgi:hypothetical protein
MRMPIRLLDESALLFFTSQQQTKIAFASRLREYIGFDILNSEMTLSLQAARMTKIRL